MILTDALKSPPVLSVLAFGSRARGDADEGSDTDVAVFAKVKGLTELRSLKAAITAATELSFVEFSLYSTDTLERMRREGSLFLWHLKLEGRILYDPTGYGENLLREVASYSSEKAYRDLSTFRKVLSDVLAALDHESETIQFESATIFSIVRNAGTILSAALGVPVFGRVRPIEFLAQHMGKDFPYDAELLRKLSSAKMRYARGLEDCTPAPSAAECFRAAKDAVKVLDYVERQVL